MSTSPRAQTGRGRHRGQAMVEFALVLPIVLLVVGLGIDVARVFQAQMQLQTTVRDTAEYLATDQTVSTANATSLGTARICTALTGAAACPAASGVRITSVALSNPYAPATPVTTKPIYQATVTVQRDFQFLFFGAFVKAVTGTDTWVLQSTNVYEVWRGRV